MKKLTLLTLLGLIGGSMLGSSLMAQDAPQRPDRPTLRHRPMIFHRHADRPNRPERPPGEHPQMPPEVRELIKEFQAARETYLEQQRELAKQLKDATDEQRAEVREQLKENMEAWRQQQKDFRDKLRERIKDIRGELHPDLNRMIDETRENRQERRSR